MGNEESQTGNSRLKMIDDSSYFPMTMQRPENSVISKDFGETFIEQEENQPSLLLKTAYHGVWSMQFTDGIPPIPRFDQCHVYDEEKGEVIIAYGRDAKGNCLNDAWVYNISENKWRPFLRSIISPRSGASTCLVGRKMFIFGGSCNGTYFSDLHSIDLDDGSVQTYDCTGDSPCPRAGAVMFYEEGTIVIWGGFDGRTHGTVHILQLDTMEWQTHDQGFTGRASPAHCLFKGKHYIFGSSKTHGLLVYDPTTLSFLPIETKGCDPPTTLSRASLVAADEFIFLIGGESSAQHMHIYALEVKRNWWFAFHIRPDGESLVTDDGIVNKIGLFMLPREFGAAVIYNEEKRELMSLMGSRLISAVPVFKISIGPALGLLHIRSDMLELFASDGGYVPLGH